MRVLLWMQPNAVLSPYEFQRLVFSYAVKFGWPGREPLTLGDNEADEAFQDAFRFLKSFEVGSRGQNFGYTECHPDAEPRV